MVRSSLAILAAVVCLLLMSVAGVEAQSPTPTPPIFDPRPLGVIPTPTPTPIRKFTPVEEPAQPIPQSWKIAGGVAGALAVAGLLYGAARAWRASNIFDRQYVFPTSRDAAVRFGGEKCGGHMATVRFRPEQKPAARSKAKDA